MQLHLPRPVTLLDWPLSRERITQIGMMMVEVCCIGLVAWLLMRLVWTLVTPTTPIGDWRSIPPSPVAVDRSIFGQFDPFFRSAVDESTAISSLSLVLSGTRVDNVSGRGSAIIATPDGVQTSYAVGDTVQPGVVLTAVGFDSVTITRGGVSEKLFIDQSAGGAPITPETAGSRSGAAGASLANEVNVTPRLQGNSLTGYTLTPKATGAAFAAAGLQPGDVLVSVDGATVTSLKDPAGLLQQFDSGGITITVERGGKPVSLRIESK